MYPIIYKENNQIFKIINIKEIGRALDGMRDGKPFLRNNSLMINLNEKLFKINEYEITRNGKNIDVKKAIIDTDIRIAGVIIKDKKILLQHRIKKGREYYVFPGGHKHANETVREALKREITEELGLDINPSSAKIIYQRKEPNCGLEKFYLIKVVKDFKDLLPSNPETKKGEINEPIFMALNEALSVDLYPIEVVNILLTQ